MAFHNFSKRSITAIIYVFLVVLCVLGGKFIFSAFLLTIIIVASFELTNLQNTKAKSTIQFLTICFSAVFFCLLVFMSSYNYDWINIIKFTTFIFTIVLFLLSTKEKQKKLFSILPFFYIVIPLSFLVSYYSLSIQSEKILLAFFFLIWANDTGAYIFGSLLGKHKLCEKISPKKTIEGTIGGTFSVILISFIFSYIVTELSMFQWFGFAVVIVIFGTLGDLFESYLKRIARVKDSGKILPGHGGILDRIDSRIFAAPFSYLYLIIILNF